MNGTANKLLFLVFDFASKDFGCTIHLIKNWLSKVGAMKESVLLWWRGNLRSVRPWIKLIKQPNEPEQKCTVYVDQQAGTHGFLVKEPSSEKF